MTKTVDTISKVELRKMKLSLKEPMIATMYSDGYNIGLYSLLCSHYRFKKPTVIMINPECVYFVDRKEKTYHFINLLRKSTKKGEDICKNQKQIRNKKSS